MRLKSYLNEITKVSTKEIDDLLDKTFDGWKKETRIIKKIWPSLALSLMSTLREMGIMVFVKDSILGKIYGIGSTKGSTSYPISKGIKPTIIIWVTKDDLKNLKTDGGIEKFKKKIRGTLAHELVHQKQFENWSDEFIKYQREIMPKIKKKLKSRSYEEYLSSPDEIEAWARQAALDLEEKGESDDIAASYGMVADRKVIQRFLKKTYQYLDMYGSQKGKEAFRKFAEKTLTLIKGWEDIENELGMIIPIEIKQG